MFKPADGPWHVGRKTGILVFSGEPGCGDLICEVCGEDETPREVRESNAKLIAMAPELLSIASDVLRLSERMDYETDSEFGQLVARAENVIDF